MDKFQIGKDACTVVRTGYYSFAVFPRCFPGSHVLELVDIRDSSGEDYFTAYLDGIPFDTSGCTGLWDLQTDLTVGESRFLDEED